MQSFATKAKKAITKVAALGAGIAMMGTTITGALAVNLNDYPSAFKDALVVVGTAASGADDTAAADVAGDIPTTAKVSQISGDTYTLEKSGNKFNINQDLANVDSSVTDTELDLLADQTFKDDEGTTTGDYDYTQTIYFTDTQTGANVSGQYVYQADTSGNRESRPVADYLKFPSTTGRYAWNYTIKITGSKIAIKDAADLENNVLSVLGRDWTITDVSTGNTSYGTVDKLTLLAGDVLSTILQGSTVGGVTVVDVDEGESKCVIEYAGKTYIVDKGQTKTMDDGTIIGVTDVTAIHEAGAGQDMCELAIGAHKLVLEDGQQANVNNEDVDTSTVFISGNETVNVAGLKYITVAYQPEDTTWLTVGESLEDPIFGAFKIVFNNIVEKDKEEIKIDLVGDKIRMKMQNSDGDVFDDYICFLNGTGTNRNLLKGYSDIKQMIVANQANLTNNSIDTNGVDPRGLKGTRFLMSFSGVSHIAEITAIDTSENKTTIKLLDTGEVYKDLEYVDGSTTTFNDINSNLRLSYNLNLQAAGAAVTTFAHINFTRINDRGPSWFTKNDGNITFWNNDTVRGTVPPSGGQGQDTTGAASGCLMTFREEGYSRKSVENDVVSMGNGNNINLSIEFRYDANDNEIEWNATGSNSLGAAVTMLKKDDDSQYDYRARTSYGTYLEQYQKDDGDLTIYFPSEPVYAELVIAATEAVTGTMGTLTPVLETEVSDVKAQNLILVGGPCANGLTAQFTGESKTFPDCNTNYNAGEAMLKLFSNGDKVALVVAGYSADDTKRAAVALGKGSSLPSKQSAKVTGTSLELSEITVA